LSQLAKRFHAKFQLPSLYPNGLRQIFGILSKEFQNFSKKSLANLVKIPNLCMQFYESTSEAGHANF
jgi:hypothetical protein